jgi:antitoxin PrlF
MSVEEIPMPLPNSVESTLTDRYQTTIPKNVRDALKLEKRDKIRYDIQQDGTVCLLRVEDEPENDPVLEHFLDFLADDMRRHPEGIRAVDSEFVLKAQSLVADVPIDLDEPLAGDEE